MVRHIHRSVVLAAMLLSLMLTAQPAVAFIEKQNTGKTGFYTINDEFASPGAVCKYVDKSGAQNDRIDKVTVRQFHTHGWYPTKTWVGYRYIIQENRPPIADKKFVTIFKSGIVKKQANQTQVAFFGPSTYKVPRNTSRYRVQIVLFFYKKGSKTNVEGKVKGQIEAYRHTLGTSGNTYVLGNQGDPQSCRPNYHGI
ncbi:MAG: hypothetical protein KF809_07900 [Chloroflexi bacterium]|nr:hypothetical protein [Chloroflexota bacterium]